MKGEVSLSWAHLKHFLWDFVNKPHHSFTGLLRLYWSWSNCGGNFSPRCKKILSFGNLKKNKNPNWDLSVLFHVDWDVNKRLLPLVREQLNTVNWDQQPQNLLPMICNKGSFGLRLKFTMISFLRGPGSFYPRQNGGLWIMNVLISSGRDETNWDTGNYLETMNSNKACSNLFHVIHWQNFEFNNSHRIMAHGDATA